MNKIIILTFFSIIFSYNFVFALDNGLGKTPEMGQ